MAAIQEYQCPRCGGAIAFDSTIQKMQCPFCHTEFEIETLAGYDRELKSDRADDMSWQCQDAVQPDLLIPFRVKREAAREALKKHYGGKFLLPGAFKDRNHIDEMRGIYVPFRLFDAGVDVRMRYRATRVRKWSDNEYDYTETRFYEVSRSGKLRLEKIPVECCGRIPDDLMEAIGPFRLSEAVEVQPAYLEDYPVEKYDADAKQSGARVNERIRKRAEDAFSETVKRYAAVTREAGSIRLTDGKVCGALFPVWLLGTTWNGRNYLFVMNGQTGRLAGELPLSQAAYKRWLLGLTGVTGTVLFAVFCLIGLPAFPWSIAVSLVPAWLAALAVTGAMRMQLKTEHSPCGADDEGRQRSMQLTEKKDLYLYRQTERKKRAERAADTKL